MNLIFIDFENVHNTGLKDLENLTKNETVFLFYSKNTPHLPMEIVAKISKSLASIELMESGVGKNAMDFVIASYLGNMINKYGKKADYFILSKDKGYKPLVDFWEDYDVELISDLSKFVKKAKASTKKTKTTAKKVKEAELKREQALRSNVGRVLTGYKKDVKNVAVEAILSSKTSMEVNNKLVKLLGSTKEAGAIYQKIKEFI